MADLLDLSTRIIDDGADGEVNPITLAMSELADGVAMVASFSHVVAFGTGDGLVLFDTSLAQLAGPAMASLRGWSTDRLHTIIYTHGHVDHVGGARAMLDEAGERGDPRPEVLAHEAVPRRFSRYDLTSGYNAVINERQFGREGLFAGGRADSSSAGRPSFPSDWVQPSTTYRDELSIDVGGLEIELHHGLGETDDHTWAWIPRHRALCVGDFVIWAFPNAGNPQKVQRYPLEWARSLREMMTFEAELLLPAHGLPVHGARRVNQLLDDTATALESLVEQTLELMNEGATLDTVVHTVRVPEGLLDRPYLRPVYDDPEFIVRNIWRGYGGWYDGNPAHLKPASDAQLACELASLVGGASALAGRAIELADAGDLRLATHLVELATQAAPDDTAVHEDRARVYRLRRERETSLMAKGIYGYAERQSRAVLDRGAESAPA
jgi:alkyl sulfatase BDS1-like metallo-beta-lactamase superfamily hydrolase